MIFILVILGIPLKSPGFSIYSLIFTLGNNACGPGPPRTTVSWANQEIVLGNHVIYLVLPWAPPRADQVKVMGLFPTVIQEMTSMLVNNRGFYGRTRIQAKTWQKQCFWGQLNWLSTVFDAASLPVLLSWTLLQLFAVYKARRKFYIRVIGRCSKTGCSSYLTQYLQ